PFSLSPYRRCVPVALSGVVPPKERPMPEQPRTAGLLESSIYVDDVDRAVRFYREVMGFTPMLETDRLHAFDVGGGGVLLVFARGESRDDMPGPNGFIPGHDGSGPLHLAFAIAADQRDAWRDRLQAHQIEIRSEVHWPRGGYSIYFGHVVELATPGLWLNEEGRADVSARS
ncbi:VOC family protein, partial [Sphingomonas adhaesiva]|uniref:VOC family protein n=1 Tax=Sphingomonas adhaesiva TaxID=28212 RepID=UPI0035C676C7